MRLMMEGTVGYRTVWSNQFARV